MTSAYDLIKAFNKSYERMSLSRIDLLFKQNKDTIKPYEQVGRHVYEIFKLSCRNSSLNKQENTEERPMLFAHYIDVFVNDFKLDLKNRVNKAEINIIIDVLAELHEEGKYIDNIIGEYKKKHDMAIIYVEYSDNPSHDELISIGETVWIIEQFNKFKLDEYKSFQECIKKIAEYSHDRYYLIMALARSLE